MYVINYLVNYHNYFYFYYYLLVYRNLFSVLSIMVEIIHNLMYIISLDFFILSCILNSITFNLQTTYFQTSYMHEKDVYHVTKSQLLANMDSMMGGRAAEELTFGPEKVTTGASSDLVVRLYP